MSTVTSSERPVSPPESLRSRPPASLWIALGVIIAAFGLPLAELVQLALKSQIYSYLILMPFVVGYLLFTNKEVRNFKCTPDLKAAVLPAIIGLCLLTAYFLGISSGWKPAHDDYLAMMVGAFLCFLFSVSAAYLPKVAFRSAAYPLAMLVFMAPFPEVVLRGLEGFLQHLSADVAHGMLFLSGMPLIREGTRFQLPGFLMEVAPECSGIRSTLALFITSLVAGYMLLKSPWRRTVLALAIIPLALLRNGFRIWTISELCVNVDPEMIHSAIHKKGGPIFFALSLVPFFALLLWLIKSERKGRRNGDRTIKSSESA